MTTWEEVQGLQMTVVLGGMTLPLGSGCVRVLESDGLGPISTVTPALRLGLSPSLSAEGRHGGCAGVPVATPDG